MTNPSSPEKVESSSVKAEANQATKDKVTPLRCFTGSAISGALASGLYFLTASIAQTFAAKPMVSDNLIVLRIASAVRTLVVGVATLGTFVFSFVTLGLILLGIQLLIQGFRQGNVPSDP